MHSKIRFINHACFSVETKNSYILVDPWFTGKIFNNSWALLKDTDLSMINFDKLTHIVISHEHPDHLHFSSLKKIFNRTKNRIKLLFPHRNNQNIKNTILKMGYDFDYLIPHQSYRIDESAVVTCFKTWIDAALVFNVDGKIILNQNDCNLNDEEIKMIQMMFPKIDAHLLQFSLAGYYGNREDNESLELKGRQRHFNTVKKYFDAFKPKTFIPFASYVYFCKEYNQYLNKWSITPKQLKEKFTDIPMQILYYGDYLSLSNNDEKKNNFNIEKYDEIFSSNKYIEKSQEVTIEQLNDAFSTFIKSSSDTSFQFAPEETHFEIFDHQWNISVNLRTKEMKILQDLDMNKLAGALPAEEVISLFKFPWGADTLNITAAFNIYNKTRWYGIMSYIGDLYKR